MTIAELSGPYPSEEARLVQGEILNRLAETIRVANDLELRLGRLEALREEVEPEISVSTTFLVRLTHVFVPPEGGAPLYGWEEVQWWPDEERHVTKPGGFNSTIDVNPFARPAIQVDRAADDNLLDVGAAGTVVELEASSATDSDGETRLTYLFRAGLAQSVVYWARIADVTGGFGSNVYTIAPVRPGSDGSTWTPDVRPPQFTGPAYAPSEFEDPWGSLPEGYFRTAAAIGSVHLATYFPGIDVRWLHLGTIYVDGDCPDPGP